MSLSPIEGAPNFANNLVSLFAERNHLRCPSFYAGKRRVVTLIILREERIMTDDVESAATIIDRGIEDDELHPRLDICQQG